MLIGRDGWRSAKRERPAVRMHLVVSLVRSASRWRGPLAFAWLTAPLACCLALPQPTAAQRDAFRVRMIEQVTNLESEYETLLYGGMARTQSHDQFQQAAPAAAFILPAFSDMFFKATNCMRCVERHTVGHTGTPHQPSAGRCSAADDAC